MVRASCTAPPLVAARDGVLRIRRADANRRGRVAGRRDAGVTGQPGPLADAVVSGRRDDDEARGGRLLHCLHQRIVSSRRVNRMAERQVDDLDVQLVSCSR